MTTCTEKHHHPNHDHKHGPNCGHMAVRHEGHIDYLHDGHLHHVHEDHVDEHVIAVDATNPCSARRKRAARTSMAHPAGTKPCPMAITSITW